MTNAYQVSIAARQLLEGYAAAMQPLCRREGLAPNGAVRTDACSEEQGL